MKPSFWARLILIVFLIFVINTDKHYVVSVYADEDMRAKKYYEDLRSFAKYLSIVKNAGSKEVSEPDKYNLPESRKMKNNVFETPKYWFSYEGWQSQDQNEKKALVIGYVVSLNEEIKKDWCYDAEERRRYDLFCKLVNANDLVDHVDGLYKNPLYRDDSAEYIIYEYMIYNFQNYIGDPITLQG
jgi:hypothetical protein